MKITKYRVVKRTDNLYVVQALVTIRDPKHVWFPQWISQWNTCDSRGYWGEWTFPYTYKKEKTARTALERFIVGEIVIYSKDVPHG